MKHYSEGDIWTTCEVCTRRIHVKDAIYVTDRFNSQFGRVVCKRDYDKTQPLNKPLTFVREKPISASVVKKLRSQVTGHSRTDDIADRAPQAPTRLEARADDNYVRLFWLAPYDQGSDSIIGYVITRATPQLASQIVINANTNDPTPYYLDIDSDLNQYYTYTVAAINGAGVSPYSELAFYPGNVVPDDIGTGANLYLCESTTQYSLKTGAGEYLTILASGG